MAGLTNRGKLRLFDWVFRGTSIPANFYVALVTGAAAPGPDTNLLSDLAEIANGNGYTTGGYQLARNSTDFDTLTEDDAADKAILKVKDVTWTASGGNLPASGSGARYAVLLDNNATLGSREVLGWWDLAADRTVSDGQPLTLQDLELDLLEA